MFVESICGLTMKNNQNSNKNSNSSKEATELLREFHAVVVAVLTTGDTKFPARIRDKATEVLDFLENNVK